MNHQIKKFKFGSTKSQQKSTLVNLTLDLLKHKAVVTTPAKAKALKQFADKLLTKNTDKVNTKRYLERNLMGNKYIDTIMDTFNTTFADKQTSYVSLYRVGFRPGDGSMKYKAVLTGYEPVEKSKLKKVKPVSKKLDKKGKVEKQSKKAKINKPEQAEKLNSQVSKVDAQKRAHTRSGI